MWYEALLFGMLGAVAQEAVYWVGLRSNLDTDKWKNLLKSGLYWVTTILMIVMAGLVTMGWYWDSETATAREYMVAGVGWPLILKQMISMGAGLAKAGDRTTDNVATRYFATGQKHFIA